MKNILVTGANGQLGRALSQNVPAGFRVAPVARSGLDITSHDSVFRHFADGGYDGIINAAAYTAVDKAESEPELAAAVNTQGPKNLAAAAREFDLPLVHVSTDFVFSGKQGAPYLPTDDRDPQSVYGKTKADGEDAILSVDGLRSSIIRTAWVYGAPQGNFVSTMLRLMGERDSLGVVADQIGSPTQVDGLAKACWHFIAADQPGVYHWTDAGVASWYDFAVAIQDTAIAMGLLSKKIPVTPLTSAQYPTPAVRPSNSVLDKTSCWGAMSWAPEHWHVSLKASLETFRNTLVA
jgi:dTDP-4-dehydrorhamnose reductase